MQTTDLIDLIDSDTDTDMQSKCSHYDRILKTERISFDK